MRIVSGPLEKQRVHYEAPPRRRLDGELERFLRWFIAPPNVQRDLAELTALGILRSIGAGRGSRYELA